MVFGLTCKVEANDIRTLILALKFSTYSFIFHHTEYLWTDSVQRNGLNFP